MDKRAANFSRLFDRVHEGVYIGTLGPDGTATIAANPHLKFIFGHGSQTPEADVRPFDRERFVDPLGRDALIERLAKDGSVTNYLLRLRRIDQTVIWIEITGYATPADAGGVMRLEALVRDVSERKKLDDETRGVYHQLAQAEKMAALGQTISGVAHELNNPLATILSWSERIAEKTLDPAVRHGLEIIRGEAERAARIVRSLLTFARKRQTTRVMVDMNHVIRETLALRAYEQHLTNISVIEALATGLPYVFADGHQLQQVLLNLVINAEQAMLSAHGRGMLVVRTWHDAAREVVVLEINDDGPGIPEDVRQRIFDPFFTTKDVGKGTGLGLTVAYAIVNEHGGRIRVESRPGSGASFFVELPVAGAGAVPTPSPRRPVPESQPVASGTILVVDDEAALGAVVAEALSDAGYQVEQARDGEQALARIAGQKFDLVICDLKMPTLDGRSFFRRLGTESPDMVKRVLFVTGDVAGTGAEHFLNQSGCRWLAKPFRLADLKRAVELVLKQASG